MEKEKLNVVGVDPLAVTPEVMDKFKALLKQGLKEENATPLMKLFYKIRRCILQLKRNRK